MHICVYIYICMYVYVYTHIHISFNIHQSQGLLLREFAVCSDSFRIPSGRQNDVARRVSDVGSLSTIHQ